MRMRKIAVFTRKGGVGKSVSCINIAGSLDVTYGHKTLLVDCDGQTNVTTCFTLNDEEPEYSIADLFFKDKPVYEKIIQPIVLPGKNDKPISTNLSLAPGTKSLDDIDTTEMFVLKDFLDMQNDKFDYCIIDCPPSLTDMTINALCAADYLIIPANAGRDSVNGFGMVVDEVNRMKENGYNVNLKILGVFLNAVDKRRSLENYYGLLWKKEFGGNVFSSQIRDSADVVNAYEFGKPLHYYKRKSNVAEDYDDLVYEIISKINQYEKRRK